MGSPSVPLWSQGCEGVRELTVLISGAQREREGGERQVAGDLG